MSFNDPVYFGFVNGTELYTAYQRTDPFGNFHDLELFAWNGLPGEEIKLAEINPENTFETDFTASPIVYAGSSDPEFLAQIGDLLFFTAAKANDERSSGDFPVNRELFVTDGTVAGTFQLAEINPDNVFETDFTAAPLVYAGSSDPEFFAILGDLLIFTAAKESNKLFSGDMPVNRELFVSDGTVEGTFQLADLAPGIGSAFPNVIGFIGETLVFSTFEDGIEKRFQTDGTVTGTTEYFGQFPLEDEVAERLSDYISASLGTNVLNMTFSGATAAVLPFIEIPGNPLTSIEEGFFISTGGLPAFQNTEAEFTVEHGTPGDADLDLVAQLAFDGAGETFDAVSFDFDINVTDTEIDGISIDFVFGSEEFPEFSNSEFVDVAAIFINGKNVALFEGDQQRALSVIDANIVDGVFIDNTGGNFPIEWNGFTRTLTVRATLEQGVNNIKIAIADTGDSAVDSGLFVSGFEFLRNGGIAEGILSVVGENPLGNDIDAAISREELNLEAGIGSVSGTLAQLAGDVVTGFTDDDRIIILGASILPEWIAFDKAAGLLGIDADGDGTIDGIIALEGDFTDAQLSAETVNGDTEITLTFGAAVNQIDGTSGNDVLSGTIGNDLIDGMAGNDRLLAGDGDDTVLGGAGEDTLNGGAGNDLIEGGDDRDRIYAEAGDDTISGGAGNDILEGKAGNDLIAGDDGNDTLRGADGDDTIDGGDGNDLAFGGNGNDVMQGGAGNDSFDGSGGNDTIDGGLGNDILAGETGIDVISGGEGNDTLRGGGGDDTLSGGADDDVMFGSSGSDLLMGGAGDDVLEGNAQADSLFGETGNDILRGGDGFDILDGGAGDDTLGGGNGNDTLIGGQGQDILRGQGNSDTFVFQSVSDSAFGMSDLIVDFEGAGVAGGDVIDLSAIDADTALAGMQAFTFLGVATSAQGLAAGAGSLWIENVNDQSRIYGIVDDDNTIDLAIRINDGPSVSASDYAAGDFIL